MANKRGKSVNCDRLLFSWAPKSVWMVTAAMKLKDTLKKKRCLFIGRKAMINLDSVLKTRDITLPTKVLYSPSYGFSSRHVQRWELDHKEAWVLKNWCIWIVVLEKTIENPLDCKEIKTINPKGNHPEYSLEELKLKLQYFGHRMWSADSLEKTLMLEKRRQKEKETAKDEMVR